MSNTNTDKVYILKKDIQQPNDHDIKAGTEFTKRSKHDGGAYFSSCGKRSFHPDIVENNPEWFSLKQPVEDKRMEVLMLAGNHAYSDGTKLYSFQLSQPISCEKYEAVKQAIERELNGEHKCVYCECWTAQDDSLCYKNPNNIPPTLERQDSKEEPKPLFVTEDGVAITNPLHVIFGVTDEFNILWGHACIGGTSGRRFSAKEAAEEYILMNKPCMSVNDVKEAFKDTSVMCVHGSKIIQLANNKINKQ